MLASFVIVTSKIAAPITSSSSEITSGIFASSEITSSTGWMIAISCFLSVIVVVVVVVVVVIIVAHGRLMNRF